MPWVRWMLWWPWRTCHATHLPGRMSRDGTTVDENFSRCGWVMAAKHILSPDPWRRSIRNLIITTQTVRYRRAQPWVQGVLRSADSGRPNLQRPCPSSVCGEPPKKKHNLAMSSIRASQSAALHVSVSSLYMTILFD